MTARRTATTLMVLGSALYLAFIGTAAANVGVAVEASLICAGVACFLVAIGLDNRRRRPVPQPDVRTLLMECAETLAPLYEFAEGQRAELERRGWSPTVAEALSAGTLAGLLGSATRGGS